MVLLHEVTTLGVFSPFGPPLHKIPILGPQIQGVLIRGFHYVQLCELSPSLSELVWKVARYTSAAPIYFTECDEYVDGGMLAKNPSCDALTKIQVDCVAMLKNVYSTLAKNQ